jgi:hypothetical protein
MPLRIRRPNEEYRLLFFDFVMIAILAVNLLWIVFDWLFGFPDIREFLRTIGPDFTEWYGEAIHSHFIIVDLVFVAIYLTDFVVDWFFAVIRKRYHRWYFYPFVHWYDLLGTIPIAGFRFLRLLRIIAITYRLNRAGVIDLAATPPGRLAVKYYGVLVEEVSDRVVLKMIDDMQDEVRNGGPLLDRIIADVIRPRKADFVRWLSQRIQTAASQNYERYQKDLQTYVGERIGFALADNRELRRLDQLPILGAMARDSLDRAVSEIVSNVIHGMFSDLTSERNRAILDESADLFFDALLIRGEDAELNSIIRSTIDRSLELVKQHVSIQHWKLRDLAEDEEDLKRRLHEELERLRRESREEAHLDPT